MNGMRVTDKKPVWSLVTLNQSDRSTKRPLLQDIKIPQQIISFHVITTFVAFGSFNLYFILFLYLYI